MASEPIGARFPQQVHDSLEEIAEEHNLNNRQGDPSKGKALVRVADHGLQEMGYPGVNGVATDGGSQFGSLPWEGAKITGAITVGLLIAELAVASPINLLPHATGFIIATIACLILDRLTARDALPRPINGGTSE
ncbi:hypothetical protein [Halobacterium sp. CBA1126]|uniref:hypothetical protein n=1 Tax=Halobacterium sp. CBA1126 TaxID=2668074 RepID=UPI0012FA337D|nr:hypothetical protein [Halobacterium sp. CBA1126]MUV59780.1 hypothetical protein [Halobacterium sp. CBA1126]